MKKLTLLVVAILMAVPAGARDLGLGPAGLLAGSNKEELEPLMLGSGKPVATTDYVLTSGTYYELTIEADGTETLALTGGDFFRAVWVDTIETESGTIWPVGMNGIEMGDEGEMTLSFIAIVPGRYTLSIPGSRGETQRAVFNIIGQ